MENIFKTRSDKKVLIRLIENTEKDTRAALDFINALIEEDAMIARSGKPVTIEEQKEWIQKTTEAVRKKDKIFLTAFFGEHMVGNTEITRQGGRSKHVGTFGISVAKNFRGEGLGKELMRRALEEAPGIGISHVELRVYEGNGPAIQLYAQMGFEEVGRLPEAIRYKDRLVASIMMWKKL